MTDPSVQDMNTTQWLFELEGLYHRDEVRFEELTALGKIIKYGAISMLGLNLMPVEESTGTDQAGDPILKYRHPNEDEFMPLSIFSGREEIIAEVMKRQEALAQQQSIGYTDTPADFDTPILKSTPMDLDELDFFIEEGLGTAGIEDSEELRKHQIWNSKDTKRVLDSLVQPYPTDDESEGAPKDVGKRVPNKAKVFVD